MKFEESYFAGAVALWTEWNRKINVISRKDMENVFTHHVLHSLAIAEYLSVQGLLPDSGTVLDLGTGGGFPGIPLAMVMPGVDFTLCDSIGKKIKVAQAVADGLDLKNVRCVNARAETITGPFDWIVSRAVTSLDNFYPWVRGKFTKGILYLKGGDVNPEISEMCRHYKVDPSKITVWPVQEWIDDDYFKEKFVIHIRK